MPSLLSGNDEDDEDKLPLLVTKKQAVTTQKVTKLCTALHCVQL